MGNSSGTASGPPPSPSPSSPRPSSPPPPSRDPPPGEASPLLRLDSDADAIVERLIACGMACVRLDAAAEALHARCFAAASLGMSHCSRLASSQAPSPHALRPDADSAHATGVHAAGWGSAYNASREGFVFSDGACFGVPPDDPEAAARFERAMRDMHASAYAIARIVFAALERRLALEPGWFDRTFGPRLDPHSQWHVKRYRPETVSPHAVSSRAPPRSPRLRTRSPGTSSSPCTRTRARSASSFTTPRASPGAAGLQTLARGARAVDRGPRARPRRRRRLRRERPGPNHGRTLPRGEAQGRGGGRGGDEAEPENRGDVLLETRARGDAQSAAEPDVFSRIITRGDGRGRGTPEVQADDVQDVVSARGETVPVARETQTQTQTRTRTRTEP